MRFPRRAPTSFALLGQIDGEKYERLLAVDSCQWADGSEWKHWDVEKDGKYMIFQLVMLSSSDPVFLALQRLWIEARSSRRTRA